MRSVLLSAVSASTTYGSGLGSVQCVLVLIVKFDIDCAIELGQ